MSSKKNKISILSILKGDFFSKTQNRKYVPFLFLIVSLLLINIRLTFQQMRVWEHTHHVNAVAFGGWHLSYFGDIDFIIKKIQSFAHQEYNNDNYLNKEKLKNAIEKGINFIGGLDLQYIKIKDNVNLPPKYDVYLKKFYKND